MRFFLYAIALILFLIALLTGGCSLVFTPELFGSGEFSGPDLLPIWGAGVAVAALCTWAGVAIVRNVPGPSAPPPPGGTPPADR